MSHGKKLAFLLPLAVAIFGFLGYVMYANNRCEKIYATEGASANFNSKCFTEVTVRANAAKLWLY